MKATKILALVALLLFSKITYAEDEPDEDDKSQTVEFCCVFKNGKEEKIIIYEEDIKAFLLCGNAPTASARAVCVKPYVNPWIGHYFKRSEYEI